MLILFGLGCLSFSAKRLGAAVGWFWFVFTGGLSVLGSFYSSFAIQLFGHFFTLWTAIIWVLIGTFLAVFVNRDQFIIEEKGHGFKNTLVKCLQV